MRRLNKLLTRSNCTQVQFRVQRCGFGGIGNKNVIFKDATIEDILNSCLKGTGLKYSIEEKTIVIWKKTVPPPKQVAERIVKGVVLDKQGTPLPGTTVVLKGTTSGVVADSIGRFQIKLPEQGTRACFLVRGNEKAGDSGVR
ncbi:MAG: STN and carboxypeptidase regulatory-like domain-containing protein [Butyricimonas faecalis]